MDVSPVIKRQFEGGWLRDAPFDLFFIFGVLALALTSGMVVAHKPDLFPIVIFLDLWFLGYHHVISTFTKLAATVEDRKENKFLIYYLPLIVFAAVLAVGLTIGVWLIVTIYIFWQWYHYTRQSYGISAYYRRKAVHQVRENQFLSQAIIWSIPVWGILHRCQQGWTHFLGLEIWLPPVPYEAVYLASFVSCALFMYWAVSRIAAWVSGTLPVAQTLFQLSHFVAFYVGYIYISDISIGWLTINIWHNAQYILFVWLYNSNKYRKEPLPSFNLISWASQKGYTKLIAYFGTCLLVTTAFYGAIQLTYDTIFVNQPATIAMLYVLTFQAVNFHHYIVDSMIWKSRIKKNQQVMNIEPSQTANG